MIQIAYLKINGVDFSDYCSSIVINKIHNYTCETNAKGNSVVDYINSKTNLEVSVISLDDTVLARLREVFNQFSVTVEYRDTGSDTLKTIACIIPENSIEYYTIQKDNVRFKEFDFEVQEL